MELYNIRIINIGRNEYRGSIVIDENRVITGSCTEKNYDNVDRISGCLLPDGMYIEIQNEKISAFARETDYFPKKSIAKSSYFFGNSLDSYHDSLNIEITNVCDIERELINTNDKKLQLTK